MRMKISIISTYGYPLFHKGMDTSEIGGTEVQLYFLAQELKKNNELSIVVSDYGQSLCEERDGIFFHRAMNLKKNISNYLRAPFLFFSALQKSKADMFIVSPAGAELYMVAIYCTLFSKLFVHRVAHESEVDGTLAKKSLLARFFLRYSLNKANAIVVQTEDQSRKLKKQYDLDSIVISNAFPIDEKKEITIDDKEGLLWVGRCVNWKRPEIVFDVAEFFPDLKISMICPGAGEYFDRIEQKARTFKNVNFIRSVSFFDIQKYFSMSKIFLSTSKKEGFPNTFLQACIGGTPIISLDVDPDRFIEKYKTGMVVYDNPILLREKIVKLLDDGELWKSISTNAISYATSCHNIEKASIKWTGLLDQLAN